MAPASAANANVSPASIGGEDTVWGVPKWAMAMAAGSVLVAGVAYYLYATGGPSTKKPGAGKKKKKKEVNKGSSSAGSPSARDAASREATDPVSRAMAMKDKGNKLFKEGRYESAIKCYTDAIDMCPQAQDLDLATFYQNRAAAYEQLDRLPAVLSDCNMALRHNPRYVKALERRARVVQKQSDVTDQLPDKISLLRMILEDLTALCILEGFQKQEHMLAVDKIIKSLGRAEASQAYNERSAHLSSSSFVKQYFESFVADPVYNAAQQMAGQELAEDVRGFQRALVCLATDHFDQVIEACNEELDQAHIANGSASESQANGSPESPLLDAASGARLLRATFLFLSKNPKAALLDLDQLIDDESVPCAIKSNALIKRASLRIQQCRDPELDAEMSLKDFELAVRIDPDNPDIYFQRGQVKLFTEKLDEALADFGKMVSMRPDFVTGYVQKLYTEYRYAVQHNDLSKVDHIIELFKEAVRKNAGTCIDAYSLLAQVLSEQQKFEEADQLYKDAVLTHPNNANLRVHQGLLLLQWKGDVAKATQLLEDAIKLDNKSEFAYETLGTLEVQRGQFKKAVELFDKAIQYCNTELEMAHLFGLKSTAQAQLTVSARLGIQVLNQA